MRCEQSSRFGISRTGRTFSRVSRIRGKTEEWIAEDCLVIISRGLFNRLGCRKKETSGREDARGD